MSAVAKYMNIKARQLRLIETALLIMLTVFLCQPLAVGASSKGDVLILLDQSISMRVYNPGFSTQWLFDFIKALPGQGDVVLAGFDERVHAPIIISRKDVESTELLQAKLDMVRMAGRVTDFEQPLQYLLNYTDDIALAIIISDGEPEIWDDGRYRSLSQLVLNDARYGELNDRYHEMLSQGVSGAERYRQLSHLYAEKNIGFIEERLAEIKNKLGSRVVLVDTYGKLSFMTRWTDLASSRLVVAQSSNDAIHELSEQEIPNELNSEALDEIPPMENEPMENMPVEDVAIAGVQTQGQAEVAVSVQPVSVVNLPPLTVTLQNAKEIFPGGPPSGYSSDAIGTIPAVALAVFIMALMWVAREFSLKRRDGLQKREIVLEQRELQRIMEENSQLEQQKIDLKSKVAAVRDDFTRLEREKSEFEKELENKKRSIENLVEVHRQARFAEVDSEALRKVAELEGLRQERHGTIEKECEAYKIGKIAAIDGEIEAEKAARAVSMSRELAAEFKKEEEAYTQKMQGRKEKALEGLTSWKIEETARQQKELAKSEEESRAEIMARLQEERAGYEQELAELKQSIDKTAEEYREKKFAEIDSDALARTAELDEVWQERQQAIEQESESLKAEKMAALAQELEAEKVIQAEVLRHTLEVEISKEEEVYAQQIQRKKEAVLEELTNWKIEETARQHQKFADELAKVEAESKEKIAIWEQDAAARVQSLLESRYREQKESYRNDLRLLATKKTEAEEGVKSLTLELEALQDELERRRHDIKQEVSDQERRMLASIKEREAALWQETVAEAKREKEEAMARIRQWENEERAKALTLQRNLQT